MVERVIVHDKPVLERSEMPKLAYKNLLVREHPSVNTLRAAGMRGLRLPRPTLEAVAHVGDTRS